MNLELLAGVLVSLAAIFGVICTITEGWGPKDEDHDNNKAHAGGNE